MIKKSPRLSELNKSVDLPNVCTGLVRCPLSSVYPSCHNATGRLSGFPAPWPRKLHWSKSNIFNWNIDICCASAVFWVVDFHVSRSPLICRFPGLHPTSCFRALTCRLCRYSMMKHRGQWSMAAMKESVHYASIYTDSGITYLSLHNLSTTWCKMPYFHGWTGGCNNYRLHFGRARPSGNITL